MAGRRILSVSELNAYIKGVFDDELILHNLTVLGEIEEFKVAGNTTYFTLREGDSRLSCVLFSVYEPLPKGVTVELTGGVRFYGKTGRISFAVKSIRPVGEGERHINFLKLKDKLEKEGLFADKKNCPPLIRSVAVVTSETGAVIHDFKSVLRKAGVGPDIFILPVRVQGAPAEAEIAAAAELIGRRRLADVAVFMRGGGSEGDLEAFNGERAARAIRACRAFTVSAVGHETDTTLCDLAADLRAGTPSIAAAFIAQKMTETALKVRGLGESLAHSAERVYNKHYARVLSAGAAPLRYAGQKIALADQKIRFLASAAIKAAESLLKTKRDAPARYADRLTRAVTDIATAAQRRLETASYRLDAQSPLKTLAKGFARIEKNNAAVAGAKQLNAGDTVGIYFADGKAEAKVTEVVLRKK